VLVVSRFVIPEGAGESFTRRAEAALAALSARPGYRRGQVARAADDVTRWVFVTEWDGVGAYRRALSAYEVKVAATTLLAESIDEPSAYEVLVADDGRHASDRAGG
jgi:heme-degrading monooxygenase HmoA